MVRFLFDFYRLPNDLAYFKEEFDGIPSLQTHFKKVSLELGGKNANIICKDADLKKALDMTIRSSFLNSGQICLCGSRLLVQDEIYDQFMTEFRKRTEELVVGDDFYGGADVASSIRLNSSNIMR